MNLTLPDVAEDKLSRALHALNMAVDQRLSRDHANHDLELQLRLAHEDRAELAERLDQAFSEIKRIEGISREASLKLDAAMETVRGVLGGQNG
jgi:hypothetical protein